MDDAPGPKTQRMLDALAEGQAVALEFARLLHRTRATHSPGEPAPEGMVAAVGRLTDLAQTALAEMMAAAMAATQAAANGEEEVPGFIPARLTSVQEQVRAAVAEAIEWFRG